ncbi:uncharacterized protein CCOS01_12162 [Colletotrichum costaricense]|uniref:Uncharacterized protein n=2 Tax=Colletotrichum acutatum species complex TaxID=2707335 RepID=A0AAI9YNR6_9PEZI|nr:uncharacterized protein CCOS01_12162 [Colletotrichum costaricense]XP_060377517.1 uncharacterized protein CTAM01_11838 [Colletotrichum tamarilloi]KAI3537053.1 hypothetical protein CSPX01_10351 [Colletotrichum filicis]KAK1487381.1 hypothetical protein CTAM01_11838 [Colletotrichum tamarilloi]KAK1517905.1 hypothetical protein CCOS01_12162 [Colletotrichum costaricense]
MVVRSPLWIWHLGVAPCRHFTALSLVFFVSFSFVKDFCIPPRRMVLNQTHIYQQTNDNNNNTTTACLSPQISDAGAFQYDVSVCLLFCRNLHIFSEYYFSDHPSIGGPFFLCAQLGPLTIFT